MKKVPVIDLKYLPTRWPLYQSLFAWLLLDRFHAAGWVKGVVWTLLGILWGASIYGHVIEEWRAPEEVKKRD